MKYEIVRVWLDYQGAGTPYGNSFEGLIEWLQEQIAYEATHS